MGAVERLHERRQTAALHQWEACGQPKVCLRGASTLVSPCCWLVAGKLGLSQPCIACLHRLATRDSWLFNAFPSVWFMALSAPAQELRQLQAEAAARGLPTFIVQDAGRTQVCVCVWRGGVELAPAPLLW